jgi:3-oxoacyl-[acyl-carrier-protein] synthase-3
VVPEAVLRLCKNLDLDPGEIGALVTNQPNRLFLRDWRKRLGVDRSRHFDTFDRYGNLYGAGVPVTTEHALRAGELHEGDLLILAGFAHAGDFAAAAAVRWGRAS